MKTSTIRAWLYAAALYNLAWGALNVLRPATLFEWIGMQPPSTPALWQVVGMFVLVYAPAYWWAARQPEKHRHLVFIGLLGKVLGPLGFVWSVWTGQLPLSFGWVILANDVVWWPAYGSFVASMARKYGWRALVRGE